MPGLDGFGVIKKLLDRKVTLPQIIFATAFDQYAVRAFEVNAVDYLLKPFDKKRVGQAVEKAKSKLGTSGPASDQIGDTGQDAGAATAPPGRQSAAQVRRQDVSHRPKRHLLRLDRGRHHHRCGDRYGGQSNCRTLEELLDSLDPNMFWRAHRSYLVNIQPDQRGRALV